MTRKSYCDVAGVVTAEVVGPTFRLAPEHHTNEGEDSVTLPPAWLGRCFVTFRFPGGAVTTKRIAVKAAIGWYGSWLTPDEARRHVTNLMRARLVAHGLDPDPFMALATYTEGDDRG